MGSCICALSSLCGRGGPGILLSLYIHLFLKKEEKNVTKRQWEKNPHVVSMTLQIMRRRLIIGGEGNLP